LIIFIVLLRKEEGRGKKEEGRRKREEGRRKREEGRGKREDVIKSRVCAMKNIYTHIAIPFEM
jgi:hypothetical protein